jgi:molybdopterin synthase sulfur carrier subunit
LPKVFIPALLQNLTGGHSILEIDGSTVREIIQNLDRSFPGIQDRLIESGRLRLNVSVAVDGEITPMGLAESVTPQSEVHFITAIRGGR